MPSIIDGTRPGGNFVLIKDGVRILCDKVEIINGVRTPCGEEEAAAGFYEMDASDGSISLTLFSGHTFNHPYTGRTYIDTDGILQFAPIDTARVEADGVLLENFGANACLQSRNFDTAPWTQASGPDLAQDETGVDGVANKAWTLGDSVPGIFPQITQTWDFPSDNRSAAFSIFIKKDADTSRFPEFVFSFLDVISRVWQVQFNTSTGATTVRQDPTGNGVIDVYDTGTFWRLVLKNTDDSNNTTLSLTIYPAMTTTWGIIEAGAEGEIIIDCAQMEIGDTYINVAIGTSYVDNDGVAIGSDLATDGDCSVGTLDMESFWSHDPGNDEYDCANGSTNLADLGIVVAQKLYRVKTVWGNITGGSVLVRCGGIPGQTITANGTYYDFIMSGSGGDLTFDATSFTGSLQEYEIVEHGSARWAEGSNLTIQPLPDDELLFRDYYGDEDVIDTCTADNTVDWVEEDCSLIFDTDHYEINYFSATQHCYLLGVGPIKEGALYRVTINVKDGTSSGVSGELRFTDDSHNILGLAYPFTTTASWVLHHTYAVAGVGCTGVEVYSTMVGAGNFEIKNVIAIEITNARDSGDGLWPAHGTAIMWWKPSYDRADGIAASYYLSTHGGSGGHMFYTPIAGDPTSLPGGTAAEVALAFTKDTWYKIVVQWGYLASYLNMYRIGYDSGAGVSWGAAQVYDGAWRIGASLILGRGQSNPHHIKRAQVYDEILTDGEIDATTARDA